MNAIAATQTSFPGAAGSRTARTARAGMATGRVLGTAVVAPPLVLLICPEETR